MLLCGASKGFMKAFKACINPFEVPQRSVKINIELNFFSSSGIGTGMFNHLKPLISHPRQFWTLLMIEWTHGHDIKHFFLLSCILCASSTDAALEKKFGQMRVVKTDRRNLLIGEILTDLLQVKVDGLAVEDFHVSHSDKAMSLCYNNRNCRFKSATMTSI